jgi:hypothetical protein
MRPESAPCIDLADRNARQVRWIDQDQLHGQKNAILLDWAEVMMLRPGRRSGKTRGCHFSSRRPYVFGLAKIGSASFARFYAAEELRNDGCLRGRRGRLACVRPSILRNLPQHRIMRIICEKCTNAVFVTPDPRVCTGLISHTHPTGPPQPLSLTA